MDNIEPKSDDSEPEIIDISDSHSENKVQVAAPPKFNRKSKALNVINKLLSKMKTKKSPAKSAKKSALNPTISTITPSYNQNFQTWAIHVIAAPAVSSTPILNQNVSRNTPITIAIYEIPSIRSFAMEFKYAPYYYLGYGFYGNPYDKNGKQCNQTAVITLNKMVNIYDKIAISLNKERNEIIIWRNGKEDNTHKKIEIQNKKAYQFIIESLDKNYHIKIN